MVLDFLVSPLNNGFYFQQDLLNGLKFYLVEKDILT